MGGKSLRKTKAELLGLVGRIVKMFNEENLTLEQIEETLRGEGYDISRESIRKTVRTNRQISKQLENARKETEALINTIRSNPATDVNEATADFLIAKAFEFVKQIESVDFKDLPEMADFIKKITKVKTDIVKQRMDYQKVYNRAKEDILAELQKALENRPDLYEQIFTIVSALEAPCE